MGLSLEQVYHWQQMVSEILGSLGYWQSLNVALYSLGIILARQSAASRVAEKLVMVGKADTVQRRLERWLANPRMEVKVCCQAWSGWVLSHQPPDQPVILLVDETKLGEHLSIMMVGVAYRSCCIPLAWWCYTAQAWPMGQVALIDELLGWVAAGLRPGQRPLVEADRGIGTSPALIAAVEARGWQYLFRVQKSTKLTTLQGKVHRLADLVKPGEYWSGQGLVFKQRGRRVARVEVLWVTGYEEPWCLVTNLPPKSGTLYGLRYWQEASFRDLKSDGWQWQSSQVWTPAHADRLVLVMSLAYALTLGLGTHTLTDPALGTLVRKGTRPTYSVFRLGLRLWEQIASTISDWTETLVLRWPPLPTWPTPLVSPLSRVIDPAQLPLPFWMVFCFLFGPPLLISVGV